MLLLLQQQTVDFEEYIPSNAFEISEVIEAVRSFPWSIGKLFDAYQNGDEINLTKEVDCSGKKATLQYMAARIHAGYDFTLSKTRIYLPQFITHLLNQILVPFNRFILQYKNPNLLIDKSRVLEVMLIKWSLDVFKGNVTLGKAMNGFLHQGSMFYNACGTIDSYKQKDYKRVTGKDFDEFAGTMRDHVNQGTASVILPAKASSCTDVFLIPQVRSNDGPIKALFGFAAKCYKSTPNPLGEADVTEEVQKFAKLMTSMNDPSIRGILFICFTQYSGSVIKANEKSKLETNTYMAGDESLNFEIVTVNIGTPEMRREFFGLACPTEDNSKIIEDIIEHTGCLRLEGDERIF